MEAVRWAGLVVSMGWASCSALRDPRYDYVSSASAAQQTLATTIACPRGTIEDIY